MRKLDPTQTVVTVIQSFMPASVTMSGAFADGQKKVSWQASVAMVSLDPVEAGFADRLTDPRQVQNHKLLLEIGLEAGQTNGYAYTVCFNQATSRYDIEIRLINYSRRPRMDATDVGRMLGFGISAFFNLVEKDRFASLKSPGQAPRSTSY